MNFISKISKLYVWIHNERKNWMSKFQIVGTYIRIEGILLTIVIFAKREF